MSSTWHTTVMVISNNFIPSERERDSEVVRHLFSCIIHAKLHVFNIIKLLPMLVRVIS